ncbi:hypothetical protein [Streptomyces sp. NRRL F-5630]|uniref:hypothetical protein n=1 Tax=Streptomyces sp. NRRL F-5630 TaxID=1463864 RepID=UPI003D71BC72
MLDPHALSPIDALLDAPHVRAEFAWATLQAPGVTAPSYWVGEGPLPEAAKIVYQTIEAAKPNAVEGEDEYRLADARALAEIIITSGLAHSTTRGSGPAPEDWPQLLDFTRSVVSRRTETDRAWANAATYVVFQCDEMLRHGQDEKARAGAYGVLRHLATVGSAGLGIDGLDPAWTLHVDRER